MAISPMIIGANLPVILQEHDATKLLQKKKEWRELIPVYLVFRSFIALKRNYRRKRKQPTSILWNFTKSGKWKLL